MPATNPTVTYRVPTWSGPDPASLGVMVASVVGFQYKLGDGVQDQDDGTALSFGFNTFIVY